MVQEARQVLGPDWPEFGLEACGLADVRHAHAIGSELGQDQATVGHDAFQSALADLIGDGLGAEGALAAGAPDIDAARIRHQQPDVAAGQGEADRVKGQFVVGRDHDRGLAVGRANGIEPWIDRVVVAVQAETGATGAEIIP